MVGLDMVRVPSQLIFLILLLIGIVQFGNILERLSLILGRRLQSRIETHVRHEKLVIENISQDIYSRVDMYYLHVRFGTNEIIDQLPAEDEQRKMKLRNMEISIDTKYKQNQQAVQVDIPLRKHDKLPTEFKLYVDVVDSGRVSDVKNEFAASPTCKSASISDARDDRVYILLKDFNTTESPEGFVNNVAYPK